MWEIRMQVSLMGRLGKVGGTLGVDEGSSTIAEE